MSTQISKIVSVELDRSRNFRHCIRFKDATGHTMEIIKVKESTGYEQFETVWKALCAHPDFHPEPRKE